MTRDKISKETITPTYLAFTWSVSRGRDTYGYNIMTITDQATGKKFRCNGGGYDLQGTSFGEWLEATYQGRLQAIAARAYSSWSKSGGWADTANHQGGDLYGMTHETDSGAVTLDGACGFSSMEKIARAIGLDLERTYVATGKRRGETTGYIVTCGDA